MLNQISHWMEYAAAAVDLVLLLRLLALRLQRTYLFLTLACALAVIFDVADLLFADQAPRVQIYSELFAACIFPLAAWDIFEEISVSVASLRRLAMLRTLASFIIISFFGLVWLSSFTEKDDPTGLAFPLALTMIVSTATSAGCLGFLWIMRRGIQLQKIVVKKNTFVWMIFFALLMAGQLLSWFVLMAEEFLSGPARETFSPIINMALNSYGMAITIWCAVKLRGLQKDILDPVSETETRP
jgi:hypothetical protein